MAEIKSGGVRSAGVEGVRFGFTEIDAAFVNVRNCDSDDFNSNRIDIYESDYLNEMDFNGVDYLNGIDDVNGSDYHNESKIFTNQIILTKWIILTD